MTFGPVKSFNQYQKAEVLQLASNMIRNPGGSNGSTDKILALKMLIALKDPRAIPLILPLMDDKRPNVQQAVKKALKASGYTQ